MSEDERPLILTLELDPESFAFFDRLRQQHFPPERNHLRAHLTLFHHLPGSEEAAVRRDVRAAAKLQPEFPFSVSKLLHFGGGVAYRIVAPELDELRAHLAERFHDWLNPQDRQGFRAHVTVQNKVKRDAADALFHQLTASFKPFSGRATGLLLWRYLGGPWERIERFPFTG